MRRAIAIALVVVSVALWAIAYTQPWWKFTLFAPQYPHGLTLTVSLTGLGGDVREIDMLNHYIGMAHLEEAAKFERSYALWGLGMLAVSLVLLFFFEAKFLWLPPLLLLGGFLGDSFYWLHHFGHHLNQHAPLHIPPFTPHLIGPGTIGQFHTTALPTIGFALAFLSLALSAVASFLSPRA